MATTHDEALSLALALARDAKRAYAEAEKEIATLRAQLEESQRLLAKTREIATARVSAAFAQLEKCRAKTLEECAKMFEVDGAEPWSAGSHIARAIRAFRTPPPGIVLLDGAASSTGSNTSTAPGVTDRVECDACHDTGDDGPGMPCQMCHEGHYRRVKP